ncbi:MAG: DoxX family protein [Granulicella sp.]
MNKFVLVCRILLGLIFFIFGMIGVLHIKAGVLPGGDAGTYLTILMSHNVTTFVGLCQTIAGLLLLVGRYVPLALTILAPIIVNILLFHILIETPPVVKELIPAVLVAVLEVFLIFVYRRSFRGLFDANPELV